MVYDPSNPERFLLPHILHNSGTYLGFDPR
jgi:hypothetical protein